MGIMAPMARKPSCVAGYPMSVLYASSMFQTPIIPTIAPKHSSVNGLVQLLRWCC